MNRCVCKTKNGTICKNMENILNSFKCKQHYKMKRTLLYVLSNGRERYVGKSHETEVRFQRHSTEWVQRHNLTEIESVEELNDSNHENSKTLELMGKYGPNFVRGGVWAYNGDHNYQSKIIISKTLSHNDDKCFYCARKHPYGCCSFRGNYNIGINHYFN